MPWSYFLADYEPTWWSETYWYLSISLYYKLEIPVCNGLVILLDVLSREPSIGLYVISTKCFKYCAICVNSLSRPGLSRILASKIMIKELLGLIWDLISGNWFDASILLFSCLLLLIFRNCWILRINKTPQKTTERKAKLVLLIPEIKTVLATVVWSMLFTLNLCGN